MAATARRVAAACTHAATGDLAALRALPRPALKDLDEFGSQAVHWAASCGQVEALSWLVETAGAHLHALNTFGCNAFQWAAQSPSPRAVDVCRWLCASGLDVAVLNCNGHSALHKAAIKGNAKVCEWLLSADGGRLSERHLQADHDGNTPASMARAEGYETLARWLEAWQRQQEQQERQASST